MVQFNKFYVTFGQKYRREPHPVLGHRPDLPDGYFTIGVEGLDDPNAAVQKLVGDYYAFCRPLPKDPRDLTFFYPKGDFGPLEVGVREAEEFTPYEYPETDPYIDDIEGMEEWAEDRERWAWG